MGSFASMFELPLVLGSTVTIPIVLFIIGLVVGVKPLTALKSGLSVSFSIVGISLLIGRFGSLLLEIASMLAERYEYAVPITDAGRKAAMVITGASEIGLYIIPLALAVNLILLLVKATRTINVDLWSFWIFAFIGAMTESLTGNFGYGIMASIVAVVFTLVMADSSAKGVEKCCGLPGVSLTNAMTASFAPVAGGVCALLDAIPMKTRRKDVTFGWLQKKIGYLGDPVLLSTVLVIIMGFISQSDIIYTVQLGMQVGAMVFITPKIMLLLGDSMLPIAAGLEKLSSERLNLRGNLTIGLSSVIGLGNPTTLLLSIIMVPITLYVAYKLPGNQFLPQLDFSMLPYLLIMVVAICRGGLLRSFISSVITIVIMLYCATSLSGLFTQSAMIADAEAYGTAGVISSMYGAGSPLAWLTTKISGFGVAGMGLLVIAILALIIWNYNRLTGNVKIYVKKQMALRASAIDDLKEEAQRRKEMSKNAVSQKRAALRSAVEADKQAREGGIATSPSDAEQLIFSSPEEAIAAIEESADEDVKAYEPNAPKSEQ
ncbi:MAG: PTS transporter subunit IIC [Angelakisella sp.]